MMARPLAVLVICVILTRSVSAQNSSELALDTMTTTASPSVTDDAMVTESTSSVPELTPSISASSTLMFDMLSSSTPVALPPTTVSSTTALFSFPPSPTTSALSSPPPTTSAPFFSPPPTTSAPFFSPPPTTSAPFFSPPPTTSAPFFPPPPTTPALSAPPPPTTSAPSFSPTPTTSAPPVSSTDTQSIIIGAVVGGVAAVLIVVVVLSLIICYCCCCRPKYTERYQQYSITTRYWDNTTGQSAHYQAGGSLRSINRNASLRSSLGLRPKVGGQNGDYIANPTAELYSTPL